MFKILKLKKKISLKKKFKFQENAKENAEVIKIKNIKCKNKKKTHQ